MADYRGGGLTNMKIREAEKLVENIRHNVEQKKKEAEGAVSKKFLFESSRKVGRKQFFEYSSYHKDYIFIGYMPLRRIIAFNCSRTKT